MPKNDPLSGGWRWQQSGVGTGESRNGVLCEVERRAVIGARRPFVSIFSTFAVDSVIKVGNFCAADMQCPVVQINSEALLQIVHWLNRMSFLLQGNVKSCHVEIS